MGRCFMINAPVEYSSPVLTDEQFDKIDSDSWHNFKLWFENGISSESDTHDNLGWLLQDAKYWRDKCKILEAMIKAH